MAEQSQDRTAYVQHLIDITVEAMYAKTEENQFLEVTYENGEKKPSISKISQAAH